MKLFCIIQLTMLKFLNLTFFQFNNDFKLEYIFDRAEYGLTFFKKFTLVMNALDNRAARNHVNRMCLAADVPLIESGTAGYEGQVERSEEHTSELQSR